MKKLCEYTTFSYFCRNQKDRLMLKNKFYGVGTALVTPFKSNKEVDFDALRRLVEYQIINGINYLVALGTTSEYVTLNEEERKEVTRTIIDQNNGRLPIVLGIGGNCTEEVVNALRNTDLRGIDAILSVVPYYNKPSQEGIYRHYVQVAKNSPLPVILYNVPGRTGVNMQAKTTLKLQNEFKNIIAVKEASGNINQIDYILRDKREDFMVISGEDNLTFPMAAMGCSGVISVSSNAFPKRMSDLTQAALKGDMREARKFQNSLLEATDLLFAEGNPVGVKAALEIKGIIVNELRLPLVKSSDELYAKIKTNIQTWNL